MDAAALMASRSRSSQGCMVAKEVRASASPPGCRRTARSSAANGGLRLTTTKAIVAGSTAVAQSAAANAGSFYLPQAFPEGSPTHPAYPTEHGTVAGACITVLKFFWDGNVPITTVAVANLLLMASYTSSRRTSVSGQGIFVEFNGAAIPSSRSSRENRWRWHFSMTVCRPTMRASR